MDLVWHTILGEVDTFGGPAAKIQLALSLVVLKSYQDTENVLAPEDFQKEE